MTWISNILNKNKTNAISDFSSVQVDIHSHLIPGLDDGSKSLDESLSYIKKLVEFGFKKLIITPHISENYFKNSNEDIISGLDCLKSHLKENNIDILIDAAAEYQIDEAFEEKMNSGKLLTFSDNYLLLELSYFSPYFNLNSILYDLNTEGYNIILAHPERYEYWQNNLSKYDDLKSRDVFFQINTISLNRFFGPQSKKTAEMLIDHDMVDFIGTDLHNEKYLESLRNCLGEKYLEKLILSGKLKNKTLI